MGARVCKKLAHPRGTGATRGMQRALLQTGEPDESDGPPEVKEATAKSAVPLPQADVPAAGLTAGCFEVGALWVSHFDQKF